MKIILAIGNTQVEDALITSLPEKCKVVGVAPYREAVLTKLEEAPSTEVVLIRDNLKGSLPILSLIHNIRTNYPHCRIILMTKQREAGDPFLSEVVSFGIWDIIVGSKSSVSLMVDYILKPRTFKDVERYQIRKMISEKDEIILKKQPTEEPQPEVSESTGSPSLIENTNEGQTNLSTSNQRLKHRRLNFQEQPAQTPIENFQLSPTESLEDDVVFSLDDASINLEPSNETSTTPNKRMFSKHKFSGGSQSLGMELPNSTIETAPKQTQNISEPVPIPVPVPTPIPTPVPTPIPTKESSPNQGTTRTTSNFNHESPSHSTKATNGSSFMEKVKKPKLFSNDDMKGIQKPKKSQIKAFQTEIKNSPIVMSLIGTRGGVGTTQTGLNLAITLANKKNRVLFVELNDSDIPFTYLYQLGNLSNGLEAALEVVASPGLQDVSSYVSRIRELKRSNDKGLANIASKYPDTLDFLAFSQFFDRETATNYHPEALKELLMGLLLSEGYQYIILDVNLRSDKRLIEQALSSSRYIIPIVTQNVLTVGQSIDYLSKIHSNLFDLNQKVYLLINRYNGDLLKERSILKWMNNELPFKIQNVWSIPVNCKAYQLADDKNYPVLINGAPRDVIQAFETLNNYLKTM